VADAHIASGPSTSVTNAKQLNPYHASWFQQFWALLGRSFQVSESSILPHLTATSNSS